MTRSPNPITGGYSPSFRTGQTPGDELEGQTEEASPEVSNKLTPNALHVSCENPWVSPITVGGGGVGRTGSSEAYPGEYDLSKQAFIPTKKLPKKTALSLYLSLVFD